MWWTGRHVEHRRSGPPRPRLGPDAAALHALGLVTPVRVDEQTGYRWYTASQIGWVDALVALKELGFTLEQCGQILDE